MLCLFLKGLSYILAHLTLEPTWKVRQSYIIIITISEMRNLSTYSLTLDPNKMVQLGPESRMSDLYIILFTSPLIKKLL